MNSVDFAADAVVDAHFNQDIHMVQAAICYQLSMD